MGHEVTLGGERLGAGKRNKVSLHGYERSTHDLSYVWRSTMAAGTLVPFMKLVALPGDTFDIDLNLDALTHPTIGPLFGSYKIQVDIFQAPVRLYQGKLHMNMLGIGLNMSQIHLPQLQLEARQPDPEQPIDNQQINPSSIFSYLGIRGLGANSLDTDIPKRNFNAIPFLAYWDIYKNYYANKQEEIGAVIHKAVEQDPVTATAAFLNNATPVLTLTVNDTPPYVYQTSVPDTDAILFVAGTDITLQSDPSQLKVAVKIISTGIESVVPATQLFSNWSIDVSNQTMSGTNMTSWLLARVNDIQFADVTYDNTIVINPDQEPKVATFPLSEIDDMRVEILQATAQGTPFMIDKNIGLQPYRLALQEVTPVGEPTIYSKDFSQEGLGLKTYNSDLFNNWINTEWIDGVDGITAITSIDTSGGSFTIDELNLSKKIYDMLNRIAISGGSYDDWLSAVYTHDRQRSAENPMYLGGLIRNLVFQEVVSNAASEDQPLGTLAGKGRLGEKHKGGHVIAKVDEPSYIIGIVSITPNIDYSQGNEWDTNLKTMNDLHKPALDEIGFQELITDQMAWFDTRISPTPDYTVTFKSAGKQPAWINYMTAVNVVKGNFADETQQMFMVLNRRYNVEYTTDLPLIEDLTTYIDPTKFNHIFADTRRDAQNFWMQIGANIEARRKMSAKVMPNL